MEKKIIVLISIICMVICGCVKETKKSEDATLKKLVLTTVSGTAIYLNENFSTTITSYSAIVDVTTDEIKIIAESNNEKAKIEGTGKVQIEGNEKLFKINVTAENGNVLIYKVLVNRKAVTVSALKLNITSAGIKVGESITLSAIVTMNPANSEKTTVSYMSNNTTVAAVTTNGVITAKAAGTAVITAKAGDKTTEVKVTVTKVETSETTVSAIAFNITKASIRVGGSITLGALVIMVPEDATKSAITYRSLNAAIASISTEGVIKGIKTGIAEIEAKAGDKTTTAVITVVADFSNEVYQDRSSNYSYTRATFPLGGNIPGPADWTRANIFVDLMKQAEYFGTADEPWGRKIQTDENSWPTEDFGVILFRDWYSIGNVGTYKISFQCSTTPAISTNASSGEITNVVRNNETGYVTADLTTDHQQDQLFLSFRNTNGGVKNLKVIRPGYTAQQTFTKEFLDHIDRFSQIRLMETVRTNESEETTWAERIKPTDGAYGHKKRRGISWEHCIELANTSKSDLWINVPHMADADYIRNLAKLIKSQLNPELNVYVEYSNEVWNWMFPQTHWAEDAASKAPYVSKLSYDGETNPGYLHFRLVGEKLKECSDIFGEVFGTTEINKRVRPVLGVQIVYGITYEQPLKYLKDTYGDPRNYIYGIAGAAYLSVGEANMVKDNLTVDDVIAGFEDNLNNVVPQFIELEKSFAIEYGLKMLQYEGGPDTYAPGEGNLQAKEDAQKDPRIKDIIIKYLENWYYAGGDLFCWYAAGSSSWYSQYGSFGLINIPGQDVGPKVEAIDAIIAAGTAKYAGGQIPTDNPKMDLSGNTAVIDFEGLADTGPNVSLGESINVGDYTFSNMSQLAAIKNLEWASEDFPSIVLHGLNWGGQMKIIKTDKKPFSIKSIRLMRPFNFDQAASVKITGYFHTRGSIETVVDIPAENGVGGVVYTFPEEWTATGMKEIKFEFKELAGWQGVTRYGAIDDLEIYETVLP